jgi:transcription antitermination factor NusG
MPENRSEYSWYALRVKSNFEKIASTSLKGNGFEEYLPVYRTRRRWSDRVKETEAPLFPGYVFARLNPHDRLPILMTPGVVGIVGFAKQPAPVDEGEIESVRRILETGASCGPWPFIQPGQQVRIERGSLAGIEGTLMEVKSQFRLVISMTLLQRSVFVEIERDCVRPIDTGKKWIPPRTDFANGFSA